MALIVRWRQLCLVFILFVGLSLGLPSLENQTHDQIEQIIGELFILLKIRFYYMFHKL